jgi:hypothetical protein
MQDMVTTLETFVTDPQTQKTIVEYVDETVCSGLPDSFAQMCQQVRALPGRADCTCLFGCIRLYW